MQNQKAFLVLFAAVVVIAIAVAVWSFRSTGRREMTPEQAKRSTDSVSRHMEPLLSNPNIPPEAKQWMEYNMRQQSGGGAGR